MKIRWREHEAVLVSMIALMMIIGFIIKAIGLTSTQIHNLYEQPFINAHLPFNYYMQVLLPKIASVILLWLVYIYISRVITPAIIKAVRQSPFKIVWYLFQALVITYILGPGFNFASFYINPFYSQGVDHNEFPLAFGFHPQPFKNSTGGFDVSLFLVLVFCAYLIIREAIIHRGEQDGGRKTYRIALLNQFTLFFVQFLALPAFTSIFGLVTNPVFYHYYFAIIMTVQAVFLTNTYWLFPVNGKTTLFNWKLIEAVLFFSFIYTFLFSIFLGSDWSGVGILTIWALQIFFITPISWLDYGQRKDKILQLRGTEEALVKSTADLQSLRAQINPHFLFNALNTLYGTALIEGSKNTAEGIQKLGDMMRFMLHENTMDYIPMEKEIEYLKNYIALQKLRTQTSPDIIIEDNITELNCPHKITPMLLIPFVENAFKHGVSMVKPSWIKIKLECTAEEISFEVRNSVHPSPSNDPEQDKSGIGLMNVQQRLEILYRGHYQFYHGLEGEEFIIKLKLKPVTGKIVKNVINLNWLRNA